METNVSDKKVKTPMCIVCKHKKPEILEDPSVSYNQFSFLKWKRVIEPRITTGTLDTWTVSNYAGVVK